ncbi:hypothetical protein LCGC14_1283990 [marine sediment metagenome]|uniref:Uncharacterized protein n=1 Tax=marine sediment metagenome TaxID=412755 RepID=A0A0F9KUD3_9ZZZZ
MASDAMVAYDNFKGYMGDGTIDMDGDAFRSGLYLSASNAGTRGVGTGLLADLTSEHANANGYLTGGIAIVSPTYTEPVAGTWMFDFADFAPAWSASGGSIVARWGVYWDDTPTAPADPLIGFVLMDDTPADITVTTGNDLNWTLNASGVYRLSGAET